MNEKEISRRAFLRTALAAVALAGCRNMPAMLQPQSPSPYLIVDGHEDIAWNALEFQRDIRRSAAETRRREMDTPIPRLIGDCTLGLPEWQAGGIALVFATLYIVPERFGRVHGARLVYETPEQAEILARQELDYYRGLAEEESALRLITNTAELDALWEARRQSDPRSAPIGLALLMEGADPILTPAHVGEWAEAGVRMIGPAWAGTRYAGGTHEPGGLTPLGKDLLKAMAELGLTLDLSHLAEQAYHEALDAYPGTLIASHSNPQRFCPGERGLSDAMIRSLAERGGVLGIVLFNQFLKSGWKSGDRRSDVPLSLVAEAVDYVAQLTGNTAHVALGSDFNGGYGLDSIPAGMDSIADLGKIAEELEKRGYQPADIQAVMGGNWLGILRRTLAGA
jgi:membrane dipeptidase